MADVLAGPWAWRCLGGQSYLVRDVGARDVILGVGHHPTYLQPTAHTARLMTRDEETGTIILAKPDQPAIRAIAMVPGMLGVCEALLRAEAGEVSLDGVVALARDVVAKVRGK